MRYSLINPPWSFEGSIYFGCREPHLPLEFGYSKALLEAAGHKVQSVDAQLDELPLGEVRQRVKEIRPDFTAVTSAPSYLFWRCAPPELRVPRQTIDTIRDVGGAIVAVGPHASTTPRATLEKLAADVVVMGECEEILPKLTGDWSQVNSIAYRKEGRCGCRGGRIRRTCRNCPRCSGVATPSRGITIITIDSRRRPKDRERRWRRRAAARTIAPSARRTISGICSGGVRST